MADDSRVTPLPPPPKLSLRRGFLTAKGPDGKYCPHASVEIDDELAEVSCIGCGAKLDPMKLLSRLAHEESVLADRIETLRVEMAALERKSRTTCRHCGGITDIRPTDEALRAVRKERGRQ